MESFTDALKGKFADNDLNGIEDLLRTLNGCKIDHTDVRDLSPVAELPFKIHDLLHIGLRRVIEIAEAAVRELNRENVSTSFILIRAASRRAAFC